MSLADIVRKGVATANKTVSGLQLSVLHYTATTRNADNEWVYDSGTERRAIIEWKQRLVRNLEGQEIISVVAITFLGDVIVLQHDKFTLPDGTTAPTVAIEGIPDPLTNRPYATKVYLGSA